MRIAIAGATGLVGRELGIAARKAGHDVVELSRATGVDLVAGSDAELDRALAGAEVVVDVTNSPTVEQDGATAFFETVAERLGAAATRAGVTRTVLLSIIGVDRTPEDGYFVAKLAHERATRRHAPGVRVLRAAQFHEFAEQSLGWGRARRRRHRAGHADAAGRAVRGGARCCWSWRRRPSRSGRRRSSSWPVRAASSWPSWWPGWSRRAGNGSRSSRPRSAPRCATGRCCPARTRSRRSRLRRWLAERT